MGLVGVLLAILLSCTLSVGKGFLPASRGVARHDGCAHHERHARHHGPARVVVAAHDDHHGRIKVRTRHGRTYVQLGAGRRGLEVQADEGGRTRVDLGGALKVETDEQGGARVRLGGLAVDTAATD